MTKTRRVFLHMNEPHRHTRLLVASTVAAVFVLGLFFLQFLVTMHEQKLAGVGAEFAAIRGAAVESYDRGAAKAPEPSVTMQDVLGEIGSVIKAQFDTEAANAAAPADATIPADGASTLPVTP